MTPQRLGDLDERVERHRERDLAVVLGHDGAPARGQARDERADLAVDVSRRPGAHPQAVEVAEDHGLAGGSRLERDEVVLVGRADHQSARVDEVVRDGGDRRGGRRHGERSADRRAEPAEGRQAEIVEDPWRDELGRGEGLEREDRRGARGELRPGEGDAVIEVHRDQVLGLARGLVQEIEPARKPELHHRQRERGDERARDGDASGDARREGAGDLDAQRERGVIDRRRTQARERGEAERRGAGVGGTVVEEEHLAAERLRLAGRVEEARHEVVAEPLLDQEGSLDGEVDAGEEVLERHAEQPRGVQPRVEEVREPIGALAAEDALDPLRRRQRLGLAADHGAPRELSIALITSLGASDALRPHAVAATSPARAGSSRKGAPPTITGSAGPPSLARIATRSFTPVPT